MKNLFKRRKKVVLAFYPETPQSIPVVRIYKEGESAGEKKKVKKINTRNPSRIVIDYDDGTTDELVNFVCKITHFYAGSKTNRKGK